MYCAYHTMYCACHTMYCACHTMYCAYHTMYCAYHTMYCAYHTMYCAYYTMYCAYHTMYCACHTCDIPASTASWRPLIALAPELCLDLACNLVGFAATRRCCSAIIALKGIGVFQTAASRQSHRSTCAAADD
jgi:hypothetical protein